MKKFIFLVALFIVAFTTHNRAANITVCASGCTFNNTQVQDALDAANPGDHVLFQSGFAYTGEFFLKGKTCPANDETCYITIRTGVNSTGGLLSDSIFPAADVRIDPSYSSVLASFTPTINNGVVFRTAEPPSAVVKWWKLNRIQVNANTYAGRAVIELGSNDSGVILEESQIAANFIVDQLFLKGHPVHGQLRGIMMAADNVTIKNSYIKDIKSQSEGQSIWCNSANGPFHVENNYLEGGAEVFMCGGDGGTVRKTATITSPTTTGGTLSIFSALHVGQYISVEVAAVEQTVKIVSCGTSVADADCTSGVVTWTPATTATPDTPGNVQWGLVPKNLTFTKNHVVHQPAWRDPIVGTPINVMATPFTTGGTLAAGTYHYKVVARHSTSNGQTARSTASAEVSATTTGTTGSITISWDAVTNAQEYYIYGRNSGGQNIRFSVTAPTTSFTDTGGAGTTEAVPTSTGTVWLIKNIFELKNIDGATIDGNVFEYVWKHGQTGYAILFTPSNTGNANDSTVVKDVTFTNNITRHAAGAIQLTGLDSSGGDPVGLTENITVSNNAFEDIDTFWGAAARTLLVTTAGTFPMGERAPKNITFNHNTFIHLNGNAMIYLDLLKSAVEWEMDNFVWKNNLGYKTSNGILGGSCSQGNDCWITYTKGTSVFTNNIIAGASCSIYPNPTNNNCPTTTSLQGEYVDFVGENYRLKDTSTFATGADDGTMIGANYTTIEALTDIAISGDNSGGAPQEQAPTFDTSSLPGATHNSAYNTTLQASGGETPYTWSITTGTLPDSLSLNSSTGAISGTPIEAGTFPITFRVTGSNTLFAERQLSLVVSEVIFPAPRPDIINWQELVGFRRAVCPTDTAVDSIKKGDLCSDLTTSTLKIATSTSPSVVWTEISTGSSATVSPQHISILGAERAHTNVPTAGEEFYGLARLRFRPNLLGYTQCSLTFQLVTSSLPSTADVDIQYWNGSTWVTSGIIAIDIGTSGTTKEGVYQTLAVGARQDFGANPASMRPFISEGTVDSTGDITLSGMALTCK